MIYMERVKSVFLEEFHNGYLLSNDKLSRKWFAAYDSLNTYDLFSKMKVLYDQLPIDGKKLFEKKNPTLNNNFVSSDKRWINLIVSITNLGANTIYYIKPKQKL